MTSFILIAVLLALLVLAAVLYPLLHRKPGTPAAWRAASVTIVVVLAGAAALYPLWSTWDWNRPTPAADSPEGMVVRLSRRLATEQDDLQGWLLLGRSYATLGQLGEEQGLEEYSQAQYSRAARAYQRADNMAKGTNRDALIGLGEALVAMDRESLGGRAGQLFEKALKQDPQYVKALLYSAFAAAKRNDVPLARSRFQLLLDGNPPVEVKNIIDAQLQQLDSSEKLAAMAASPGAAAAASVSVHVTLSPAVASKANAGAPLFVLARVPGQRGPPLAAKRLDARFPQDVQLSSNDAMIAGTGFAAGQELEIEARVANGGSAISRSGDPFGVVRVKVGTSGPVSIEISQLKP